MRLTLTSRVGTILLLSVVSIVLHEFGHYIVYKVAGIPVHVTLQSVRPIVPVSGPIADLGLVAGPILSLIAAVVALLIARQRPGFFWVTAAFTNATIRLLPCTLDLLRVFQKRLPFSDEGNFALSLSPSPVLRAVVIMSFAAVAGILTVLAIRRYEFQGHLTLKALGVYLLSVGLGIGVVIVDELLHPAASSP